MSRDAWLTPDLPPGTTQCRVLVFPDAVDWLAIVAGALLPLTRAYNFEDFGTATAQQTADVFADMFDKFSFNLGVCRVIGEIITWAGSVSPDPNWLFCDGASLLRTAYPDLFAVIGTTYGAVDGTHFSLPDMQSRVAVGAGSGSGLSAYTLGQTGGEEAHTLISSESPAHSHSDTGHTHAEGNALPALSAAIVGVPIPSAVPSVGVTGIGFAGISSSGGGGSHNNIEPYLALNFLIVAAQ